MTDELDGMLAYGEVIARHRAGENVRGDPNWPMPSFDARDWARAFVERVTENPGIATDEGTMLAWFAGALMRGFDECASRQSTD